MMMENSNSGGNGKKKSREMMVWSEVLEWTWREVNQQEQEQEAVVGVGK